MENTLFLEKLLGLWMLFAGIGMLFNCSYYQKAFTKLIKDESVMFISGLVLLAGGLTVVLMHNTWAWNWSVLTTLLGWGMLIKGFLLLALPNQMVNLSVNILKYRPLMIIGPVIWIIGGLVLAYYGFYA